MKISNKAILYFVFSFGIAAILFAHSYYYFPFLSDDALISLRYAERFMDGKGLTWNDGEYVEGYSNLLWILIISGLGYLGVDLVDALRIAGFTLYLLIALIVLYLYFYKFSKPLQYLILPFAFFVFSASVAVWAIGGLEQPILAILFAVSIISFVSYSDNPRMYLLIIISISLGLMVLTRPDAPLFVIAFAVSFLLLKNIPSNTRAQSSLITSIVPGLIFIGQLLFRLLYYEDILPNTAYVKLTPSVNHFINGLLYITGAFTYMLPFFICILYIIWKNFKHVTFEPILILTITTSLVYLPYLVFIGGDVFPAYRHFIVLFVLFFIVLAKYSEQVYDFVRFIGISLKIKKINIIIALIIVSYVLLQSGNHDSRRAKHERWEWIGKELGETLFTAFNEKQPLVAVTAAGCIPYWSKLPALDMLGLNDKHIARNHPDNIGSGMLGHELGDANYILGRKPDLIIFNVGEYPTFRPGRDLIRKSEFQELYKPLKVYLPENNYFSKIFFRIDSPKTGVIIENDEMTIPGYLFADTLYVHSRIIESKLVLCLNQFQSTSFELEGVHADYELLHIEQNHENVIALVNRIGNIMHITLINPSEVTNYVEFIKIRKVPR